MSSYQRSNYSENLEIENQPEVQEHQRMPTQDYRDHAIEFDESLSKLNPQMQKIVKYQEQSSVPSENDNFGQDKYDEKISNNYQMIQDEQINSNFENDRQSSENQFEPNFADQFNPISLQHNQENENAMSSEQHSSANLTGQLMPNQFQLEGNLNDIPLQMNQTHMRQTSSERISIVLAEESKQSNRHQKNVHRSSSNNSQGFSKGSSQHPVRQQNLYPQLSPQILHSSFKGRLMNVDGFNDQENRNQFQQIQLGNNAISSQTDSLSKPAIINQNSNTKQGGRSYLNRISPSQQENNVQNITPNNDEEEQNDYYQVFAKENQEFIQNEPYKIEPANQEIIYNEFHQRNPSSNSAFKTTVNYGLSVTNPTSQNHYGTILHEIDGLDLTDENINNENNTLQLEQENQLNIDNMNKDQQIDLSNIQENTKESQYVSDYKFQMNDQPDALKDLEIVEAELQAEVNQLDLMYEQHKQATNNLNQRTSSEDYYNISEYNKNEIVHPQNQRNDILKIYGNNLDQIKEEYAENTDSYSLYINQADGQNSNCNINNGYDISSSKKQSQEYEIQKSSNHSTQQDQIHNIQISKSQKIPDRLISKSNQFIRHDNQNKDKEEESSSRDQINHVSSSDNLIFSQDINFAIFNQMQQQIQNLTVYKDLCEQRIRDLSPGHPLPIQNEHIGQPNIAVCQNHQMQIQRLTHDFGQEKKYLVEQIQSLQQQLWQKEQVKNAQNQQQQSISDHGGINNSTEEFSIQLNQQYLQMKYSFEQLRNEKASLEKALRNETQQNQENNIKLQILKDQLQKKFKAENQRDPREPLAFEGKLNERMKSTISNSNKGENIALASTQKMSIKSHGQNESQQIVDHIIHIGMLEESNKQLKNEILKLNTQINTEKNISDLSQRQHSQYQQQVQSLINQETGHGRGSIEQIIQKSRSLEKELQSKLNDTKYFVTKIEELQSKVSELEAENCQNRVQLQEQQVLRKTINSQSTKLAKMNKEINDLQSQNLFLKSQVEQKDSFKDSMIMSIKSGQEQISQYKEQMVSETNQTISLQKQLDHLSIQIKNLQREKNIIEDEKNNLSKKHSVEIDNLRNLLNQNKKHMHNQEQISIDQIQKLEEQLYSKVNTSERNNLQQTQQIQQMNHQINQLQQKLFATELEKQNKQEVLNQNLDLEKRNNVIKQKFEMADEINKKLQNQFQMLEQKNITMSKKNKVQEQQISNLKQQNQWLKEEREQIGKSNQNNKQKFQLESQQNQELKHQLELVRNKLQIEEEQNKYQIDKIKDQNHELTNKTTKLEGLIQELKNEVHQKNIKLQDSETTIKATQKVQTLLKDENQSLQNQIVDLQKENQIHYQTEDKTKSFIIEIEKLKELNFTLEKEQQYNTKKIEGNKSEIDQLEKEIRILKQDKQELESQKKHLEYSKKTKEQQILDQLGEISQLKDQIKDQRVDGQSKQSQYNIMQCKTEDLQNQLKKQQKYIDELKSQINKQIKKNNDNCLKFQKDQDTIGSLIMIQKEAHEHIISPFLKSFDMQFDISDILKESLITGYKFLSGRGDEEEEQEMMSQSNYDIETQNQRFKDQLKGFQQLDSLSGEVPYEKQVLEDQKQLMMSYIKFLQQEIIDKLISSLIEHRSTMILQEKRQNHLNKTMDTYKSEKTSQSAQIDFLTNRIKELESKNDLLIQEQGQNRIQTSSLKQQIHKLNQENKSFKSITLEKEIQLTQLMEKNFTSNEINVHNQNKINKFDQLDKKLNIIQIEKSQLWKVLKAIKVFFKSNNAFDQIQDMLNEYIVLLEQLVVQYQDFYFKGGSNYTSIKIQDEISINNINQKLKKVIEDIKQQRFSSDKDLMGEYQTIQPTKFVQKFY